MSSKPAEVFASTRPAVGDWPAIADRLGALRSKLKPILAELKGDIDLEDELTKECRAKFDNAAATLPCYIEGEQFKVIVGPRRNEARIADMGKLLKRLTRAVFFSICKISQDALKKTDLSEDEIKKFLTWEKTGWRPVEVVAKVK